VRLARAGTNDVKVRERGDAAQIEDQQVFSLLLGGAKGAFAS
jgi:hypothetical protein